MLRDLMYPIQRHLPGLSADGLVTKDLLPRRRQSGEIRKPLLWRGFRLGFPPAESDGRCWEIIVVVIYSILVEWTTSLLKSFRSDSIAFVYKYQRIPLKRRTPGRKFPGLSSSNKQGYENPWLSVYVFTTPP